MKVFVLLALIAAASAADYNQAYGYGMPEMQEGVAPTGNAAAAAQAAPAADNVAAAAAPQAAPQAAPEQEDPNAGAAALAAPVGTDAAAPGQAEEDKKEVARPAPMSPAKDYPANQNLPPAERPEYRCELCMMVIGRKLQRHTLCDSLEHERDVNTCHSVVETLTVYDRYLVDWLYGDGCQRSTTSLGPSGNAVWRNVKPCPAHVVCSWMIHTFTDGGKRTFCQFEDTKYRRSPAFHLKHHIPTSEVEESNEHFSSPTAAPGSQE